MRQIVVFVFVSVLGVAFSLPKTACSQQVQLLQNTYDYRKICGSDIVRTYFLTLNSADSIQQVAFFPARNLERQIKNSADGLYIAYRDSVSCNSSNKSIFFDKNSLQKNLTYTNDTAYLKLPRKVEYLKVFRVRKSYLCEPLISHVRRKELPKLFPLDPQYHALHPDSIKRKFASGLKTMIILHYKEDGISNHIINQAIDRVNKIDSIDHIKINGLLSVENILQSKGEIENAVNRIATNIKNQHPDVKITVKVEQNWDDFYNDVQLTRFSSLANKSKLHIKKKLISRSNKEQMEPVLSRHRKIVLEVHSLLDMSGWDERQLLYHYKEAYNDQDLNLMLLIQNQIFERINEGLISANIYSKIKLPYRNDLAPVFLNQLIHNYEKSNITTSEAIVKLSEMRIYFPDYPLIDFNLAKFQLDVFKKSPTSVSEKAINEIIESLGKSTEYQHEYRKARVYYHLIKSFQTYHVKNYDGLKFHLDRMREFINAGIFDVEEVLTMADILIYFNLYPEAEDLIFSKIKMVNFKDEKLTFNYLLLPEHYKINRSEDDRIKLLQSAYNMNPERFCNMLHFDDSYLQLSVGEGNYKRYCGYCHE